MPEAAEVAVAAGQLDLVAAGRPLLRLDVTHPRTTRAQPADDLQRFVGRRVDGVRRHGKWIVVTFDGSDEELGVHLRMSGQLLAVPPGTEPPDRHVHAVLALGPRPDHPVLASGTVADAPDPETRTAVPVPGPQAGAAGVGPGPVDVWFRDPRTFGEIRRLTDGAPVAPDLFDGRVTADVLHDAAGRRRVGVKAVLLDQLRSVSGIGSYLADEALHRAGISPVRPAGSVDRAAWERILDSARAVATESAAAGGVTLPDEGWVDLWGRPGRHGPALRVHGRDTCAACDALTRRAVVGGRSARWCPRCQRANRRR
jgi:formamidopyrimidine-DNA glycosylase